MITLDKVKSYLNIDFIDNDEYLNSLMSAAIQKAETIMGGKLLDSTCPMYEVENAILEDIAAMYTTRGESQSGSQSSINTYRRYSKRPMF